LNSTQITNHGITAFNGTHCGQQETLLRVLGVVGIHLDLMAKRLDGDLGLLRRHLEVLFSKDEEGEGGALV
jgi:hypothetical protein